MSRGVSRDRTTHVCVYHDGLKSAADGRILLCRIQPHLNLASEEAMLLNKTQSTLV